MKNYSLVIEQILYLKSDMRIPRRFEVEHNDYHHNRLQPTDIDIITETLGNRDKFEFAYELFCRTLLAQIIHSSHRGYFRPFDYDRSIDSGSSNPSSDLQVYSIIMFFVFTLFSIIVGKLEFSFRGSNLSRSYVSIPHYLSLII